MSKEVKVTVQPQYIKRYKKGCPIIEKDSIRESTDHLEEGTILNVFLEGQFFAKGYYGKQNKGIGWILTHNQLEVFDQRFFENKIHEGAISRQSYEKDDSTTGYRLFNGEGDGIGGLTIDYLDGCYLVTWYSLGIYQYKEPILDAINNLFDCKAIYEKKRFDIKGQYLEDDDFVMGQRQEFPIIVKENGVNFAVYLNDGPMIGYFLDQKDVRNRLKNHYSKGKKVLNTFSYTGAFSVYAALGGAISTTSVDLAKRSLEKTKEQFRVNGIDEEGQRIVVQDVFDYFKYAVRKKLTFDVVILDPPSFARSKKRMFSVAKDYAKLLEEAIMITEKKGVILASTNYSNGDMEWFIKQVDKAFRNQKVKYKILESYQLPKDFRYCKTYEKSNYLKVLFIQKL